MSSKRPGTMSDEDRALIGRRTPRTGVPSLIPDDVTDRYEGEELLEMREIRAGQYPAKRIAKLETDLYDFKLAVTSKMGEVVGAIGELTGEVKGLATVVQSNLQREQITFNANVDVAKRDAIDAVDARKAKRDAWIKLGVALITGGAIGKFLHMLGVF